MLPRRFQIVRPYLASLVHRSWERPPVGEVLRWLSQPGAERRARRYLREIHRHNNFWMLEFEGFNTPFYYPAQAPWVDLCHTIDECFSPANWHHFITPETPLLPTDTVVDCGAAEGLFSFVAAPRVHQVYAIEPVPLWQAGLHKTFDPLPQVTILPVGVGHQRGQLRMSNETIFSHISAQGELSVAIETVDHLFFARGIRVDFLKADIEGYEFQMLLGAEQTIRANRPRLALTVYHEANHVLQLQEFLAQLHPDYRFRVRGLAANGHPVLLLAF
jgi:FkbM family methyltransferase